MRTLRPAVLASSVIGLLCLFSASVMAQAPSGSYRFIKDNDGKTPKTGADITLTFSVGTFALKATMPGQVVEDVGTWKVTGSSMTLSFKDMAQGRQSGAWSLSNGTLTLPVKMLSDGTGSSTWQQVGTALVPTGTVTEVITRNLDGVRKITRYTEQLDKSAAADAKKYKGGLAESYYVQGTLYYFKGWRPEALYGFAKAAQLQPTNALFLNNLSNMIMDYGKWADAVILMKEVTRTFPNLAPPFGNLAIAQLKVQNLRGADSAIRIARRLDPTNGLYCYTDGKIKEEKGDKAGAQKDFDEAWSLGYAGSGREGSKASAANASNRSDSKNGPAPVRPSPPANRNATKTKGEEQRDKIAQWEGHYEANVVSARSGETAQEANTTFGKDLASTTINLKTLACAKEFSMDISKGGVISGTGRVMYVYQGSAGGPVTALAPTAISAMSGGFGTNLKDGFQIREWSFSGTVDEDGNVEINGLPSGDLDLYNVGKWQKIKTWSPLLPDAAGAAMKGPFHMKLVNDAQMGPVIKVDHILDLGDKLIRKVHYRAYIVRTDGNIVPDCQTLGADPTPKCPASEFIKTKVAFSPNANISVEQSTTYSKGESGGVQAQQEMAVNVVSEHEIGPVNAALEYHQDNSFEISVGIGVSTEALAHGSPVKLSEKLDLIYDSKCGWGVKASAGAEAGGFGAKTGASVEGVIFFNKGM